MGNNTYKVLTVIFAIVAIIFAVLYFTKDDTSITDTYDDVTADLRNCSDRMSGWLNENRGKATTTEEQREDLEDILGDCERVIQDDIR